jgi:hypothetical protein
MLKAGVLQKVIILILFVLCTCIDPYFQKINNYGSLLVVDGLITDENCAYTVRLSGTIQDQNGSPVMVSDATVFITDNSGNSVYFDNIGNGLYKTDSTMFRGQVGKTYVLHIITGDGGNYESDQCLMQVVPEIDRVYYERDQELVNNGTESLDGIRIYLDSGEGDNKTWYRWEYEETWKFKVPDPAKAKYISEHNIIPVTDLKEYCWKSHSSDEILIHSFYAGDNDPVKHQPVLFIAPDNSDRLLIRYSILIKQYSISGTEYDFWNNLTRVSESGSDIFAAQPYAVPSNIHNLNKQDELVLGYFQVSSVKQMRLDISVQEIAQMNLPFYHYKCERVETCPTDPIWIGHVPPLTFDQLYERYTDFGYIFIEPRYFHGTTELDKIIFTLKPECSDCELSGTSVKPDFWVDLN